MAPSNAVIEAASGAVAAVIALSATYPLITVSTLKALEHRDVKHELQALEGAFRLPGPLGDIHKYARARGWGAVFAGLKPAVLGTAASQGIYFYVYSWLRQLAVSRKLRSSGCSAAAADLARDEAISVGASLVVAAVAGCTNVALTLPIWVVITQMQALQKQGGEVARSAHMVAVARQMYSDGGLRAFWQVQQLLRRVLGQTLGMLVWQGLWPSLVMVVNPTLQYILYEWLVARLLQWRSSRQPRGSPRPVLLPRHVFLLSAVAKLGSTLATYPLLVVKNRLQAINRHTHQDARYSGVADAVARIASAEGLPGFYKGMSSKMVQTVLAAALLMGLKEQILGATHALMTAGFTTAAARAAVTR